MHNNVFWKMLLTTWRTQGKLREFGLNDSVDTMLRIFFKKLCFIGERVLGPYLVKGIFQITIKIEPIDVGTLDQVLWTFQATHHRIPVEISYGISTGIVW